MKKILILLCMIILFSVLSVSLPACSQTPKNNVPQQIINVDSVTNHIRKQFASTNNDGGEYKILVYQTETGLTIEEYYTLQNTDNAMLIVGMLWLSPATVLASSGLENIDGTIRFHMNGVRARTTIQEAISCRSKMIAYKESTGNPLHPCMNTIWTEE